MFCENIRLDLGEIHAHRQRLSISPACAALALKSEYKVNITQLICYISKKNAILKSERVD
jgi:hypothetical protein